MDDLFDTEILFSPRFLISVLFSSVMLWYLGSSWKGRVQGLTGYLIIGGIGIIIFAYFWAARSLDND